MNEGINEVTKMQRFKVRRPAVAPKVVVFLGLFLCLVLTTTLDTTRADSAFSAQSPFSSEIRSLRKDQKLDLKVFIHLQKSELSGFRAAQEIELKEWENGEKKKRHKFFEDHPAGAERRSYIQDFIKRRDDLHRQIAFDKAQKIKEQNAKLKSFREEQDEKLKKLLEQQKK